MQPGGVRASPSSTVIAGSPTEDLIAAWAISRRKPTTLGILPTGSVGSSPVLVAKVPIVSHPESVASGTKSAPTWRHMGDLRLCDGLLRGRDKREVMTGKSRPRAPVEATYVHISASGTVQDGSVALGAFIDDP